MEKKDFSFTDSELEEVKKHIAKYPDRRSAVMPVLWMAQNKYGWLSNEAIQLVADTLELPFVQVYGVATFYTMYFKRPAPKYVLDMCTCFTCGECGGQKAYEKAKSVLSCDKEGISEDGMFWIRHAECLGACDTAPVAQITNGHYVHNMTEDKIEGLIEQLRSGNAPSYVQIPLADQSKI